ncbi:MAG: xanthine dehydrogenase family protein molybdopterin-binding subunit [Pseudomonadota bacterium]|nr:xanthine dehydrogenase family protein molybdopterin-binding subunit [Pseudomonadota bacterium]
MNVPGEMGGIGDEVLRKEDGKFLTGAGRFVGDMHVFGELHANFVRSPHAHADITGINVGSASGISGVHAVLTGEDMKADGVGAIPFLWTISNSDGSPMKQPPRWGLARNRVRHVGEPVAVIIADSAEIAMDAAEAVIVNYKTCEAVTGSRKALAGNAPQIHSEAPGNMLYSIGRGDVDATNRAITDAPHSVTLEISNNRVVCAAIETRTCIADPDPAGGQTTLFDATQAPHLIRKSVTDALGIPPGDLRVVAPDVGGGFGTKGKHYPEETVLVWAARRLKRPIRWTSARSEAFMSDTQARDHQTTATLAFNNDGAFLGLKVDTLANVGAYISTFGASIPGAIYPALLAGVYRTPAVYVGVTAVFTNTVPTDAYRGAGRPEACYVLERLADAVAKKLNLDRAEVRRRNLIGPGDMPYQTPVGPVYDTGNFPAVMEKLLSASDWASFLTRRLVSESRGKLRGIGVAMYVETSGVAPSRMAGMMGAKVGFFESAEVRVDVTGGVQVLAGTHNHGQGHETTYAQIVSDRLGLPFDGIAVLEGDTDAVPMGTGTFGSRSIAVGGSAIVLAVDKIIEKGRRIAAHLFEAADEDVTFLKGVFSVSGTDRQITLEEVAKVANLGHILPANIEPGLNENAFYDPPNFAYSNGGHVVEVEIDQDTGTMEIQRYCMVDDIGTVINPMIVQGQIHGGIAQGLGQALTENATYECDTGQILSGSFLDYCIPRADDLIKFEGDLDETQPCTHNPLGAKGCGESGAIGAPAALVSAALDALGAIGVTKIEMPLSPLRVWEAIQKAQDK